MCDMYKEQFIESTDGLLIIYLEEKQYSWQNKQIIDWYM